MKHEKGSEILWFQIVSINSCFILVSVYKIMFLYLNMKACLKKTVLYLQNKV